MDHLSVQRVSERLQAAFVGNEGWQEALGMVSEVAGARGAAIIPLSQSNQTPLYSRSIEGLADDYSSHWHQHDFRFAALPRMLRTGVAVDQDIASPDIMSRLPYYSEYLARHGVKWFAGIAFRDGADAWCLAIQRTPEQGPFEQAEQVALQRMGCALSQSVSAARCLAAAYQSGILVGLEGVSQPAVLLDQLGRVVQANAAVSESLRQEVGIDRHGFLLGLSSLSRDLKVRIKSALQSSLAAHDRSRLPLLVPRRDKRPLLLRVRALHGANSRVFDRASILVLIDDPDREESRPIRLLQEAFGLTGGQARVAASIGAGNTVKACADELGIATETVRSVLQKTFHKIGVARQADLVRIVSRLRE